MKPNKYFNHSHPVNYNLAFQTIEDGDSRNSAVQSGSVDISGGALGMLSDRQIKQDKKNKNLTVEDKPSTVSHFMAFNPDNDVLKQRTIREAISKSIDTKDIAGKSVNGLFQKNVQFVNKDNQQAHDYDVKRLRSYLKKQVITRTVTVFLKTGKPLTFNLVIQTAEFPSWKDKAEKVQRQLKKLALS